MRIRRLIGRCPAYPRASRPRVREEVTMTGYCADCGNYRVVLWRRDDVLRCGPCTLAYLDKSGVVEKVTVK